MIDFEIGGRKIGPQYPPYCIAELSCSHGGDINNAIKLIKRAKLAGADAVKTQCYTADTITLRCDRPDFIIKDGLWKGRKLWDLYHKAHTPFDWHKELYKVAKESGIMIFSSVFDKSAVDYLEGLNCPAYKIASMEISDPGLIEYAASTGKPLIISTGMASFLEILDADAICYNKPAAFLHCTSEYPGTIETSNLLGFKYLMGGIANRVFGISDHSPGANVAIAATALGACIIEKHIGLPEVPTEDEEFNMTGPEFGSMVEQVRQIWQALQPVDLSRNPSRQFRRSLYAADHISAGEPFTEKNVRSVRPGYGLPCKELPRLLGKPAKRRYSLGDRIDPVEVQ